MSEGLKIAMFGAKSLDTYSGYETFVYKLTEYRRNNPELKYHVACKANVDGCINRKMIEERVR